MAALARDFHVPVGEVRNHYEKELKELNENTGVKVFHHLLVTRKVREIIKDKPFSSGEAFKG
jgi:hypothetical protein